MAASEPPPPAGDPPATVEAAARRLADQMPQWNLLAADETARDVGDGLRGHRVVLRRRWKEFKNLPQQAAAVPAPLDFQWKTDDWEWVLIPGGSRQPADDLARIDWADRPTPFALRNVWAGNGHGYAWFTRATIYDQEHARERMKLTGGQDRIQLVVDGLLFVLQRRHRSFDGPGRDGSSDRA